MKECIYSPVLQLKIKNSRLNNGTATKRWLYSMSDVLMMLRIINKLCWRVGEFFCDFRLYFASSQQSLNTLTTLLWRYGKDYLSVHRYTKFFMREYIYSPVLQLKIKNARLNDGKKLNLWLTLLAAFVTCNTNSSLIKRGIEWSLQPFASMWAVHLFLRARAVINFLMRAASTS